VKRRPHLCASSTALGLGSALLILSLTSACASTAQSARASATWTAATLYENPVSRIPSAIGMGLGAIVTAPLIPLTWLMTLASGRELSEEDQTWSSISPAGFGIATFGVILGGPFYLAARPFQDDEPAPDPWEEDFEDDEVEEPGDEDIGAPPGGELDPTPTPWRPSSEWLNLKEGRPPYPLRRSLAEPWAPPTTPWKADDPR
jgi:hypothetical protein